MGQILDRVLTAARQLGASDVHLKAGLPPLFRIKGDLQTVRDVPALTREAIPTSEHPAMMNSRSIASTSKLLAVAVAVAAVLGVTRVAEAGRKRVVVLEFEGPRSEKFHDDLVRLIKKTHTVVPAEKWNGTAEQLGAGTRSGRDAKKVARKLKVDAIVEGKIEKRRDEFIIRLKLRAGK